jgi:Uncharacterized protein family UPF0029
LDGANHCDIMGTPLDDELMSINSIYGLGTLTLVDEVARICTLQFPTTSSVTLRLKFPENYPDAPPSILGTESTGDQVRKGTGMKFADSTRGVLAKVYRPGDACLYDLIEEMSGVLEDERDLEAPIEDQATAEHISTASTTENDCSASWIVGTPVMEKKSVFAARAAPVSSPDEAKDLLRLLLATDKKVGRATHNIVAWRVRGADGTSFQDCDDDGEAAAGGRLLHLMQVMDVWDVIVVVSRFFGGIKLGPDRFRIINNTARDILVAGGFTQNGVKKGKR